MEEIKDLATPGWGQANGGVSKVFGMTTDGVSGEIHLNHEGDTCATKTANYSCEDTGFTVSLFMKPENRADGRQQTFFKSLGKFVVYQEANSKSLIVRVQHATEYCLKEIAMPEKIWSHLAFTYNARAPQTLTVYRNGQRIDKFIRDDGCNKAGIPEFSSSSVLLGAGDGVFAKATYFHIAIWKQVLPEERIAQLYHASKCEFTNSFNFNFVLKSVTKNILSLYGLILTSLSGLCYVIRAQRIFHFCRFITRALCDRRKQALESYSTARENEVSEKFIIIIFLPGW